MRMEPWWMGLVPSSNRTHTAPSPLLPYKNTRRGWLFNEPDKRPLPQWHQPPELREISLCYWDPVLVFGSSPPNRWRQRTTVWKNSHLPVVGLGVLEHCSGTTTAAHLGPRWNWSIAWLKLCLWRSPYRCDSSTAVFTASCCSLLPSSCPSLSLMVHLLLALVLV